MKVLNSLLALSMASTAFASSPAIASNTSDTDLSRTTAMDTTKLALSSHNCVEPTKRDYHDILAAYSSDTSVGYKFSGCGGVL